MAVLVEILNDSVIDLLIINNSFFFFFFFLLFFFILNNSLSERKIKVWSVFVGCADLRTALLCIYCCFCY